MQERSRGGLCHRDGLRNASKMITSEVRGRGQGAMRGIVVNKCTRKQETRRTLWDVSGLPLGVSWAAV